MRKRGGSLDNGRYRQPDARNVTVKTTVGGVRSADVRSSKQNACAAKKSVAGTKRRKSKASTTFFFVALLPLVRRSSLRAPNHDGAVVESVDHCCSHRDGERAHERRQREQHQVLRAALLEVRAPSFKLRWKGAEQLSSACCACLRSCTSVHFAHVTPAPPSSASRAWFAGTTGSLRLMPRADHTQPLRFMHFGLAVLCLPDARHGALHLLPRGRTPSGSSGSLRSQGCLYPRASSLAARIWSTGQYVCVCVTVSVCAPSTAVRTSKRHSVTFCGTQQHKRQPLRQIPYSSACTCR